jgi:hypothetical protein
VPSIAEALSASIVEATSTEVEPARQYVAFPSFYFAITPDALATDGRPAAFDFVHRVNMVPESPPQFTLSAKFVWDVYERVLLDRELPPSADGHEGYAVRFAEASAKLGSGQMSTTYERYFPTGVTPVGIDEPSAWSTVALDAESIRRIAANLDERSKQWFERFNTLPALGADLIESVTFDRLVLVLLRPWFDPEIFASRFWKLSGDPISDGAEPPRGRLPGVVSKLVLLRNLKLKFAGVPLPEVETVVYRSVDGGASAPVLGSGDQLVRFSSQPTAPSILAQPLNADGGSVSDQVEALRAKAANEIAEMTPTEQPGAGDGAARPIAGAQRFHVPFVFDSQATRAVAKNDLDHADADYAAKEAALGDLKMRVAALQAQLARERAVVRDHRHVAVTLARDHRHPGVGATASVGSPGSAGPSQTELDLAAAESLVPAAEQALAAANIEKARWEKALRELDSLDASSAAQASASAMAHALALICDRTPKSPNPDLALFGSPA